MKTPLRYQITEYDCGPTSLLNAISFLFDREDIPPDVPKYIMMYCLDTYNDKGEFAKSGTSQMAMMFLTNWMNQFAKAKKFPIACEYLSGNEVQIGSNSTIIGAIQQGGAVILRVMYGCWHYVLATGIRGQNLELFDPYYRKRQFIQPDIQLLDGSRLFENRRVSFRQMNLDGNHPYTLGDVKNREAVIIYNKNTRKTPEKTIEYFL